MALLHFKEGLADFKKVVSAAKSDPDARRKYKECAEAVRRIAFEEAIAVDHEEVEEVIDWRSIDVEEGYTGARMDDSGITLEFVMHMMQDFKDEKRLHRRYCFRLLEICQEILDKLPPLVYADFPEGGQFTVCGDIHGQYYDLMNIFALNGLPSEENPYLFNGDFVDRGSFSTECIFTLIAFKCLYPNHFHMTRGNHETINMNKIYGFDGEVRGKYSEELAKAFPRFFCSLPLSIIINRKAMVVHGGLFSKDGVKLSDIEKIDRFREPPDEGLMCELLWSDPQPQPGRAPSKRGVGVGFGPDVTANFLADNDLDLLIRSHEVKEEGYEVTHNGKCITVFSAPNYCDQMGNQGAYIRFEHDMKPQFHQFEAVPHPAVRPMAYASPVFNYL
eukprot:scaffold2357_cov399-Prasinococcus_capsulatus_cf.AAC.21